MTKGVLATRGSAEQLRVCTLMIVCKLVSIRLNHSTLGFKAVCVLFGLNCVTLLDLLNKAFFEIHLFEVVKN